MHVTAIMRTLRIVTPSWILSDESLKQDNCCDNMKNIITIWLITAEDCGKDLVGIAEIELHWQMDNKEISKDMNVAIETIMGLWSDPLRIKAMT